MLAEKPDDPDRQRNVALVEKYIADRFNSRNDNASALLHFTRALELDERRLQANPGNRSVQFDVAVDLCSSGLAKRKLERLADASVDLQRCLAIREGLAASDTKDVLARDKVAAAHHRLGALYLDMNRLQDALNQYRKAVAIAEPLASVDANEQHLLSEYLASLGSAEERAGDHAASCRDYRRVVQLTAGLLAKRQLDPRTELLASERHARIKRLLDSCNAAR